LAFSAINHIGFLIIALSINNKISLESFVFYLTQYSLTNINIFLIIIAFGYINYLYPISSTNYTFNNPFTQITNTFNKENLNVKTRINGTNGLNLSNETTDLNFINQLTGIFKNNSILTLSFVICLFSMAGIPPLLGFFAKQQILLAALSVGFVFLSIIAINTSVISAFYYLKLIQVSTFSSSNLFSTLFTNEINNNSTINNTLITNNFENNTVKKDLNSPFLGISNNKGISIPPFFNSNNSLNRNLSQNLNNFNIITLDSLINSDSIESNINLNPKFTNIHSYLISILTLIILFFTLKPNLLLNLTNILTSYSFTL
jgi:Proton-conducting membrane transporter